MKQSLEKLEAGVYQLAQKFETVVGENKRLNDEIARLKIEQEQQKGEHQAAVDELSEALLVQVSKLKEDLQAKIDSLMDENRQYREQLQGSAEHVRRLLARLPQAQASETLVQEGE